MNVRRSGNFSDVEDDVIIQFIRSNVPSVSSTINKEVWEELSKLFTSKNLPYRTPVTLKNHFWRKINPFQKLIQQRQSSNKKNCAKVIGSQPSPSLQNVERKLEFDESTMKQQREDFSLFSEIVESFNTHSGPAEDELESQELVEGMKVLAEEIESHDYGEENMSDYSESDVESMDTLEDDSDDEFEEDNDNESEIERKIKYLAFTLAVDKQNLCKLLYLTGDLRAAVELSKGNFVEYSSAIWSCTEDSFLMTEQFHLLAHTRNKADVKKRTEWLGSSEVDKVVK